MALGRNQLPDQVNPPTEGRSVAKTGMEPVSPEARRDYQADREAAIREMIADYERNGKDTSHLKSQLGRKSAKVTGAGDTVVLDGPAVLEPGQSPPNQVYAPVAETVPEPEDGSAPDKRDQDQTPKPVKGFAEPPPESGATVPVTATDPGPEAPKKKADGLPDQVSPDLDPPNPPVVKSGDAKGAPALPNQGPARTDGDRKDDEEKASAAKKAAAAKAPAKKTASGRAGSH